jgi:hypothetical protein
MSNLTRYQQVESADVALIAESYRILAINEPSPNGTRLQTPAMHDQDRDRLVIKTGSNVKN